MDYIYDTHQVRYCLVHHHSEEDVNWLFIPGGPGADSRYLKGLIEVVQVPGKSWLVDLPNNGDNIVEGSYDFNQWFEIFKDVVRRFDNCIVVGHSFGAMLALMLPELEHLLKGFVIFNSSPSLWFEESEKELKKHNFPTPPEKAVFLENPNQENYEKLILASLPKFFTLEHMEEGKKMFNGLPFPYQTTSELLKILMDVNYNAQWIPQQVKTLIIGGSLDMINPFSIFLNDRRFDRPNIEKITIENAGHWCWVEKPEEVKKIFQDFAKSI